jgi:hypothetical protein
MSSRELENTDNRFGVFVVWALVVYFKFNGLLRSVLDSTPLLRYGVKQSRIETFKKDIG